MGGRRRRVSAGRRHLAVHLVPRPGLSCAEAARQLGVSPSGIAKAVARADAREVHFVNNVSQYNTNHEPFGRGLMRTRCQIQAMCGNQKCVIIQILAQMGPCWGCSSGW